MKWLHYFDGFSQAILIDVLAAVIALITWKKYRAVLGRDFFLFMSFLFVVVFTEVVGQYSAFIYLQDLDDFQFFCDYPGFLYSDWLLNIYSVVSFIMLGYYFRMQLIHPKAKQLFGFIIVLFAIATTVNLLVTDIFFKSFSKFTDGIGVLLLTAIITYYYYEILTTDNILKVKTSFPFIVSIACLVYYLCATPLFLVYDLLLFEEVVLGVYYDNILTFLNIFLYGMFIFGMLTCYWFNKSLNIKFS